MIELSQIAQAIAVMAACWAIISGIGAWKREFIGKRKIELAEEVLASFFEVKDAISAIRNSWSSADEGKTRKRQNHETEKESLLLDRGYVIFERYETKKETFIKFYILKYKFMAVFGTNTESIFIDTQNTVKSIFIASHKLSTVYWKRQGEVKMEPEEFQKHLEEMEKQEGIFWEGYHKDENDEILKKLLDIEKKLESITKPCFEEPIKTYSIFTKKWFNTTN